MDKIRDLLTWLQIRAGLLKEQVDELKTPHNSPKMPPSEHLYRVAVSFLNTDASPLDKADDEVGCAESVSNILQTAFGDFPIEIELATWILNKKLDTHSKFKRTLDLDCGNIIISPTGSGNGSTRGHVGIIGKDGKIMSSESATGLWKENYSIDTWVSRYRHKGGMPVFVYKRIT